MTIKAINEMEALAAEMQRKSCVVASEFAPLPSGIAYLHVRTNGRCFVMAFYPKENGFGVDELQDGEGFETGYRHWFTSFDDAKVMLAGLVGGAQPPETQPT